MREATASVNASKAPDVAPTFGGESSPVARRGRRRAPKTQAPPSPMPLTSGPSTPWYKREYHFAPPVKVDEVMNFTRQAASFLRAGIPILDALRVIGEDCGNKHMAEVLADVQQSLRGGLSFGAALARHHRVFPNYYVAMVRSAELTGRLDDTLDQLALYLERDLEARRKVKSALTYPSVIVVMAVVAVFVLAIWVMPKFKDLFSSLDADLPLVTRMLLGFSGFMSSYWWLVLAGLAGLLGVAYFLVGGARGKSRRDRLMLRLPAVGTLVRFVVIERFCRVLSAMVQAGVPLPDALSVAADSTNNHVFRTRLAVARDEMIRGEGLSGPIGETGLFPAAARQMIRVGESTGTLDAQLESAAVFYEREVGYRLKRFTDLFEPAIIVVVGLVVGFIALALVQAMYGVFDQVQV